MADGDVGEAEATAAGLEQGIDGVVGDEIGGHGEGQVGESAEDDHEG